MKVSYKATYVLLKFISNCLRASPLWIRKIFSSILYVILYYLIPIRKNQVYNNLKAAFPDKSEGWYKCTTKHGYKFFIENFIQFFTLPSSFPKTDVKVKGEKLLIDTLKGRKGIVFVSGHFGAWEILAAWLGYNKYPVSAVATKQRNLGADKFFLELRSHFGMNHIYRKASLDNMYSILEKGEILALVSDQDAKQSGVFINFFDMKTSTPKGAAQFHLKNGAPIIFTVCYKNNQNSYTIEFHPIISGPKASIESITQAYTTILEKYIRRYPEQYFWFHRRWKTQNKKS